VTDLVEAARYSSRVEADLARLFLESEGIEALLFDAGINNSYGGLFMPVRLMVLDGDLERAQGLLESSP
jgi:Putative prokaryotic signal transducing protein